MDTIFVNSKNTKISEPHRLLINHADKIDLKRSDKYVALSNLRMYCTWKNIKNHTKTINLQYHLQHGVKTLIYFMDHILYQIFKIILSILLQNLKQ